MPCCCRMVHWYQARKKRVQIAHFGNFKLVKFSDLLQIFTSFYSASPSLRSSFNPGTRIISLFSLFNGYREIVQLTLGCSVVDLIDNSATGRYIIDLPI